jgi:hypothetical protein
MATPTEGLTAYQVLMLAGNVVAIIVAVIVATVKIVKVLRDEVRGEIGPIMSRIDSMEKRFIETIRDLWDHNTSQDVRIDAVTAAHNRLRGAHDATIMFGGHQPKPVSTEYSGPERRREARPPKCSG